MNKFRKVISVIIINLLLLLFILAILEFTCLIRNVNRSLNSFLKHEHITFNIKNTKIITISYLKILKFFVNKSYLHPNNENYFPLNGFRTPSTGSQYKNENIILAGCSFTYGDGLEDKDTFSSQLARFAPKYKVYNIGISGASAKELLYILRNCKIYEKNNTLPSDTKNTKYFIYTYIYDHEKRLILDVSDTKSPDFKIAKDKNGTEHLEYVKPHYNILKMSFLAQYIIEKMYNETHFDLQKLYVKEIKREVEKIFPNAEFVIFVYEKPQYINQPELKELKKSGINIVNINNLSDIDFNASQYKNTDNFHPNAKAWEKIIPLLSKQIGLK